MDINNILTIISPFLTSWAIWGVIIFVLLIILIYSLWLNKNRRFYELAIIVSEKGNGKVSFQLTKVGWVHSKKILNGLIGYGVEKRFETKDGRIIQQGSTSDFHQFNNFLKKSKTEHGFLLLEKNDDPKILLPISEVNLTEKSRECLLKIAPADFRDACSKIINDAENETKWNWTTASQILVLGFVGLILFISIILVIQYSQNAITQANEIHQQALSFYQKVLENLAVQPGRSP